MTRSVRYQPILHTLYYTLHTEHAYCLSYRFLNNVVITTLIEMVEKVEILGGKLGKRSVERERYVIMVIVQYGVISLVLCISTRLRLVTILSPLVKYLVILHADPCNKSYWARVAGHTLGCSIEISRDIYVFRSWSKKGRRNYVGQILACSKSLLGSKIRPVSPVLFISTIR